MSNSHTTPYSELPASRYWRSGVREPGWPGMKDLYRKKFPITQNDRIATAGSCFAQHIAVQMKNRGFSILDLEPVPPGLAPDLARRYGFGLYSARYGNIYTLRQLLQLVETAFSNDPDRILVWQREGRYFDALRPTVEPNGLDTAAEVRENRLNHLAKVRRLFLDTDIIVFRWD